MRFARGGRALEKLAGPNATKRREHRRSAGARSPPARTRGPTARPRTSRGCATAARRCVREVAQQALLFPATRAFAQPTVIGAEDLIHAPQPAILAPNHESDIDTPLVLASLPYAWRSRTVVGAASRPLVPQARLRDRGRLLDQHVPVRPRRRPAARPRRGRGAPARRPQRPAVPAGHARRRAGGLPRRRRRARVHRRRADHPGPHRGHRAGDAQGPRAQPPPQDHGHVRTPAAPAPRRDAGPAHRAPAPGDRTRNLLSMIERAPFGATGHESSRVIFGAAALAQASKEDADRTLELLLEHGINHIDVAAAYGDAELRVAPWLTEHEFFLATKTGQAHVRGGQGGDPPLARAARRRPLRLDPAPQPRRRDRVGHRAQRRRRAGGGDRGPRRRPGARSSASPATGSRCRRCTRAASSGSTSTACCARTTTCRCRTRATRRRSTSWRARAPSATSRCRRSRASRGRRGRAASTPRRRGTSRSPSSARSTSPSTGCSATRRRSCSPPATSRSCRGCSTPPSATRRGRTDEEMRALELAPLFT